MNKIKTADIDFLSWIVLEDEHYCVVNKPPFIPSLPERGKKTAPDVLSLARDFMENPVLCHRIDRETSGALVIAKNPEAYRAMSMQLEARTVSKLYHAVVEGVATFKDHKVNYPINTDHLDKIHIDFRYGKPAETIFNTLEHFRHFTLIECKPVTGRLHQIRVHLKSQNYCIAGDELYGGQLPYLYHVKKKFKQGNSDNPMIARFALHARSIEFKGPDEVLRKAECNYPKDFELFLKLLHKWDL